MRRTVRLKQPSGWKCATPRRSIAPFSTQCTAARVSARPLSAAQRTTGANRPRFYSQQPTLPQSLTDAQERGEENVDILSDEAVLGNAFRPPPSRTRASAPDQVSDPSYTPAFSSEGLSTIGGLEDWWDRRENWSKTGDFAGFKAKKKIQDARVLETAVRRALVEVTALQHAARQSEWVGTWPIGAEEELSRALAVELQVDAEGNAALAGDHAAVAADLSWEVQEVREAERATEDARERNVPHVSTEEAESYLGSWGSAWKQASLADPTVKFAVTKRVFQLTGQLVPDHKLDGISSISSLLTALKKAPKAKTLSEEIQRTRQHLVDLPNVAFSPKQVTRGDKAKAVGQYKIIEQEFKKRDLQGGHLGVSANKEKHWFKGEA